MSVDTIDVIIGGEERQFKFSLITLKKVTKKIPFHMIQEKPLEFILEAAYYGFLSRNKKESLPPKFNQDQFEEWFDDLDFEDSMRIAKCFQNSMEEVGKILNPQEEEEGQTVTERKEETEEEITKD